MQASCASAVEAEGTRRRDGSELFNRASHPWHWVLQLRASARRARVPRGVSMGRAAGRVEEKLQRTSDDSPSRTRTKTQHLLTVESIILCVECTRSHSLLKDTHRGTLAAAHAACMKTARVAEAAATLVRRAFGALSATRCSKQLVNVLKQLDGIPSPVFASLSSECACGRGRGRGSCAARVYWDYSRSCGG